MELGDDFRGDDNVLSTYDDSLITHAEEAPTGQLRAQYTEELKQVSSFFRFCELSASLALEMVLENPFGADSSVYFCINRNLVFDCYHGKPHNSEGVIFNRENCR